MVLQNCRVVLVRPRVAGNLGATARVMRNLGVCDLVLVAPEADPADPRARRRATHGQSILKNARCVADLGDAVADCLLVVGTSARTGGMVRRQSVAALDAIMPVVGEALTAGPAALVFGPERTGLTNDEVSRCHHLIHIPTDPAYRALNLAQAVTICLYELRRAWLKRGVPEIPTETAAPFADQERMFDQLREALEGIHFLYGPKADSLMHALRHLIGRARPSAMEVKVLFGLARQLRWFAAHGASPLIWEGEAPAEPGRMARQEPRPPKTGHDPKNGPDPTN
jgi:tRNA/rRNA methyltransferase